MKSIQIINKKLRNKKIWKNDIGTTIEYDLYLSELDFIKNVMANKKALNDCMNVYNRDMEMLGLSDLKITNIKDIDLLYPIATTKWIDAEYYAHEYDKYADAKVRELIFKNIDNSIVIKTYEVQCLNNNLLVADGIWSDDYDTFTVGRLENGSGDHISFPATI